MSRLGRHLGVFVVVLGAVLLVAAIGPGLLGSSSGTSVSGQSPDQFQPSNLQLETIEETGSISVDGSDESKTVVIDLAHSNSLTREQVTPLFSALVEAGHEVRFVGDDRSFQSSPGSGFNATLQDADAYVVAAPSARFASQEIDAVEAFAEADGCVLILEETPTVTLTGIGSSYGSGVGSQADHLAGRFDVAFGTSYLYDMAEDDTNFQAVAAGPAGSDELLEGVERAVFREPVPVRTGEDADPLLQTSGTAALESTRETGEYTLLSRTENVVAVGDTTFLTPDSYREADNEVLLGNLATFLVDGEKDPCVPATASSGSGLLSGPSPTPTESANGTESSAGQQCERPE